MKVLRVMLEALLLMVVLNLTLRGIDELKVISRRSDIKHAAVEEWTRRHVPDTTVLDFGIVGQTASVLNYRDLLADDENLHYLGVFADGVLGCDVALLYGKGIKITSDTYVSRTGEGDWKKFLVSPNVAQLYTRTDHRVEIIDEAAMIIALCDGDSAPQETGFTVVDALEEGARPLAMTVYFGEKGGGFTWSTIAPWDIEGGKGMYLSTIGSNGYGRDAHVLFVPDKLDRNAAILIFFLLLEYALCCVAMAVVTKDTKRRSEEAKNI